MRLVLALVLAVLSAPALAQPGASDTSGLGTPFVDKDVATWFGANPAAYKTVTTDGLDHVLVPGGDACANFDMGGAIQGGGSEFLYSPDKKLLAIITSAKLVKKTAKQLKLAAAPDTIATVLVMIDGASGALWARKLDEDGCKFQRGRALWSADNKKLLAITDHGETSPTSERFLVLDVAAKKIRMDGSLDIAQWEDYGIEQLTFSDVAFVSASKVTVCVARTKDPKAAPLQYEIGGDPVGATKKGACPAAKAAPAPAPTPAPTK